MKQPYATYVLLAVNLLVFAALAIHLQNVLMNAAQDSLVILRLGANINPLTLGGQPWRMITSMFLHYGIWHLLANMFALYFIGVGLESQVGTLRFILIYFICGIAGNLLSLVFNVYVAGVGASGAIFGLYGYLVAAFLISNLSDADVRRRVMISFVFFVLANGLITVLVRNVDVWGHVGGFVAGVLLALAQFRFRLLLVNGHLAVLFLILVSSMLLLPDDQVRYYRLYQSVLAQERTTNDYYNQQLGDAEMLDSLRASVAAWDSISEAFKTIGPLREELHHDTTIVRQYVRLHRRVTHYRASLLEKESYIYFDSIEIANAGFDSVGAPIYFLDYFQIPAFERRAENDTASHSKLTGRRVFYDAQWKETDDPSAALYYRLGQVDSAGRWQGAVRDYYRNGDVQMKGTYTNNLKDGVFLYYSDHHTYSSAGRYRREEAVGKWENFHWNGKLQSETYYGDKTFVATVFDSLGGKQVAHGNGVVTTWHSNGKIAETGQYRGGMRTGDWLGYHEDGTPYYREQYRDNRLVQGAAVDAAGKRYVYDELSQFAYPVKGMQDFEKYVEKNIRRPYPRASGARIRVLFQVGRQGELWDFVILEGNDAAYEQEAIRLIREGPRWRQGLEHGHIPLPSQGYAVIVF
jgi:membrane associated rhomboid family serine protease